MDDGQHNIAVEVPDRLLPFWVRATAFFAAFIGLALVSGVLALVSGFGVALVSCFFGALAFGVAAAPSPLNLFGGGSTGGVGSRGLLFLGGGESERTPFCAG